MSDVDTISFEKGSGNVFLDIGFDDATAARLSYKAELVSVLHRAQVERRLTQGAFGRLVGIPQARLSNLYGGKLDGMSTDKLLAAVGRLGAHVVIRVEAHPQTQNVGRVELELI